MKRLLDRYTTARYVIFTQALATSAGVALVSAAWLIHDNGWGWIAGLDLAAAAAATALALLRSSDRDSAQKLIAYEEGWNNNSIAQRIGEDRRRASRNDIEP